MGREQKFAGRESTGGGIFQGRGGGMSELLAGGIGRDSLSIPSCYIPFDLKFYVDYEC